MFTIKINWYIIMYGNNCQHTFAIILEALMNFRVDYWKKVAAKEVFTSKNYDFI